MWRSFARRSFTTTMALRQSPPPLLFPRPTLRVPPPLSPAARFFSETSGNANEYKTPTARVGGAMLAVRQSPPPHFFPRPALRVSLPLTPAVRYFSAKSGDDGEEKTVYTGGGGGGGENEITVGEVKKLMRLVNVEALKTKLAEEGKEVIGYAELLKACESLGVARSIEEAANFARVLDDAGVVLLFRDKVYLHPDKVVELVRSSVPLALAPADDPRREELRRLQERKEEIDRLAHRQVRYILWGGLGVCIMQVGLFFRLTFWEFSWDVMEPIAFFTTASGLVIGYAYFMITSKDPTYQDLMKTLFLSRQRKLIKKYNFDMNRFKELVNKCKCPFDKKHINESLVLENL